MNQRPNTPESNPNQRFDATGDNPLKIASFWKDARSAIEHENNLVNHRLTWLLTSQAFLFGAYAVIYSTWTVYNSGITPLVLMCLISVVSLYICFSIRIGAGRAKEALDIILNHFKEDIKSFDSKDLKSYKHLHREMGQTWVDRRMNEPNLAIMIMVAWGFLFSYPTHRLIQRRERVVIVVKNLFKAEPTRKNGLKSDSLIFKYDESVKKTRAGLKTDFSPRS